ncbi:extracellular solute-binding protein [Bradyrhizobium erythrophlei]|jgi:putative spermidine/putrescine transport system substrate-binding protein|uniref:Putative spermidine/putrescine transport system substrate-binding protein n=1 Tax=Bradyrhizobium erythrophlei TaxID=1437360 RepID=A0A1M5MC13_9BRAD|nr:extracellular solute-binding protein [Bradyrhizobium erythrophlei]SHG74785.1 putative spermidine/putrescine transport system substrate-binding protein [Bradyrhizobium erythrophlei]
MIENLSKRPSRRRVIATIGGAILATPYVWSKRAWAALQLPVRTPGGSFDEIKREHVYEPFRKATGIEIIPVPATVPKLLAMHRAGQMEVDLIDTGDDALLELHLAGALMPIDYGAFRLTNPDDLDSAVKRKEQVGNFVYAMVKGFRVDVFPKGKEPKSWEEFWDIKAFPGPRTMSDMASGAPNLEFALIADGVVPDKVYPIDIDRAFKSMSRVRPAVTKFWDTGALSTQMLIDKEVVLASLWSTRLGVAIDRGAPLGAQWKENMVLIQSYGIPTGSRNVQAAQQFIDFSLQPDIQANWMRAYKAVPVNRKAYASTAPELINPQTNQPWTQSGFPQDIDWWAANRNRVNTAWSKWIVG